MINATEQHLVPIAHNFIIFSSKDLPGDRTRHDLKLQGLIHSFISAYYKVKVSKGCNTS